MLRFISASTLVREATLVRYSSLGQCWREKALKNRELACRLSEKRSAQGMEEDGGEDGKEGGNEGVGTE